VHSCETLLQIKNHYILFLLTRKQPVGFLVAQSISVGPLTKDVLKRKKSQH